MTWRMGSEEETLSSDGNMQPSCLGGHISPSRAVLSNMAASDPMWLLSPWHMASATDKLILALCNHNEVKLKLY